MENTSNGEEKPSCIKNSLIEFPLDFTIKVYAKRMDEDPEALGISIVEHVKSRIEKVELRSVRHALSAKNNYVSYSMTFFVTNKAELDNLYYKLREHEKVVMLL